MSVQRAAMQILFTAKWKVGSLHVNRDSVSKKTFKKQSAQELLEVLKESKNDSKLSGPDDRTKQAKVSRCTICAL